MEPSTVGLLAALMAGLATAVGSLEVFFLARFDPLPFAVCLAFSSGVMTYISFAEILPTSREYFRLSYDPAGVSDLKLTILTTGAFFIGWIFTTLLDIVASRIIGIDDSGIDMRSENSYMLGRHQKDLERNVCELTQPELPPKSRSDYPDCPSYRGKPDLLTLDCKCPEVEKISTQSCSSIDLIQCDENLWRHSGGLSAPSLQRPLPTAALSVENPVRNPSPSSESRLGPNDLDPASDACLQASAARWWGRCTNFSAWSRRKFREYAYYSGSPQDAEFARLVELDFHRQHSQHHKVGIFTAVALAIHNFPEGIATYSASLVNLQFGLGVAIAIGAHNIPEGLAVAVPIFYGTGSRWKGFLYGMVSGLAEPVGALIGHLISHGSISAKPMGWISGLVAGMMTNVGLRELYPEALRYDPLNRFATACFSAAMMFMAGTIILLQYSGIS